MYDEIMSDERKVQTGVTWSVATTRHLDGQTNP
jgi:hypothetical protein